MSILEPISLNLSHCKILYFFLSGKTRKLKEAKEEAQAEIRTYRGEREKQFLNYQQEVLRCVYFSFVQAVTLTQNTDTISNVL